MIQKLKLINLVGARSKLDDILQSCILDSDVQFENPLTVIKETKGFNIHMQPNPYADVMKRYEQVFDYAGVDYSRVKRHKGDYTFEQLGAFAERFDSQVHSLGEEKEALEKEKDRLQKIIRTLTPIEGADVHLDYLDKLKFMKFRFGRLPNDSYAKLDAYLNKLPTYFVEVQKDRNYTYGFYFVSSQMAKKVDHIFASLYFEREWIETENEGTPKQIIENLTKKMEELDKQAAEKKAQFDEVLEKKRDMLIDDYAVVKYYFELNELKKNAVYTKNTFYLTFWADEETEKKIQSCIKGDAEYKMIAEEPEKLGDAVEIPTKLKNLCVFKPFEEFVKMYGVPRYNEIDPTPFLAIVYTILFGMMFGDVGHGVCLMLIGILLTCMKKGGFLANLLIPIGISSAVFGFLYGTCFGFEGDEAIIHPLWFTPMEQMTRILITTVAIGAGIILLCMLFNIINGVKQRNWQKILFSQNGVAGIVFYVCVLYLGVSMFMGSKYPFVAIMIGIVVSLLLIFLQEPLSKLVARKKDWVPKEKGGFFVESFFELFEILLSFVTNTMSFVRVGAFALNHAGMMSVVLLFMHQISGAGSIVVAIFGNLMVMGIEGLIVGIQVLRLGFYEMFSRFYDGDGKAFHSVNE